jgi:drug/metabolite transporter (DMT)-like permease
VLTFYAGVRSIVFYMEVAASPSADSNVVSSPAAGVFSRKPMLAFGVLIAVNAMWAFQFSGARIATRELGAVLVTLLPMAIATLLVMPFAKLNGALFRAENRSILIDIVLLGTLGVLPAQLCLVLGVQRTLASNASVLALTVPVLTALSASIFLHERMTKLRWVSFAIAILGVCLVSVKDIQHARLFTFEYMAGNLLVLASCAGSAFNNSFSRRALSRFSPAQVLVWSFIVTDLELLVLYAVTNPGDWRQLPHLGPSVWWSLVLVAIFSLGLSMLLYFSVIQAVEVMRAAVSVYLLPVFGLLFSALLLGEKLTPNLLAGGVLIFASCFLVTVYEEKQRLRRMGSDERI